MIREKPMRIISPEQLLARINHLEMPLRLRTATDVLPGGYAGAMAPLLIQWDASDITKEDGFVIIHNLNHGGNPVDGTTVLCSARVPLNGVEAVEFILIPLDKIGRQGLIQHGMLRFIFSKDQPVELLNFGNASMGSDTHLYDLVFSWEAWRAPDMNYDVKVGMNPDAYLLSPRVFSGPTRFLDDALGKRDWFAYRLRLPHGRMGFSELLKTTMAMGDGAARHTVSSLLEQSEEQWAEQGPSRHGDQAVPSSGWEKLKNSLAPVNISNNPLLNLSDGNLSYQSLLRSCATLAYYTINVATDRLVAKGHVDGLNMDELVSPDLGQQESWMSELADTDLKGIFLRTPAIIRHLRAHPEGFPKRIPHQLEKAGLLEMVNGRALEFHYRLNDLTPYGTLKENLIK